MGGAACAKIIINGRGARAIIENVEREADLARVAGEYLKNDEEIIKIFNEIEDLAFKAQKLCLEGQGFKGPWPNSMK